MAYPNDQAVKADNVAVNPTLHSGMLSGLINLQQCIQALDQVNGPQGGIGGAITSGFSSIGGIWGWVQNAAYIFGGMLTNVSLADGDAVEIELHVPSTGTYTLFLNTPIAGDCPIIKLFLDEVAIGAPAGYDLYGAPPDVGANLGITGLVLAAGVHKLKILVDGLNALSTDYAVRLSALELVRTA